MSLSICYTVRVVFKSKNDNIGAFVPERGVVTVTTDGSGTGTVNLDVSIGYIAVPRQE